MGQKLIHKQPIEGVNTDLAPHHLKDTEGRYLLNCEVMVNAGGGNEGLITPLAANRHLPVSGLSADYLQVGCFEARRTREVYVWCRSETKPHTIYRINHDLTTTIVYQGPMNLSADPAYAIRGAYLFFIAGRKYLVWTDGRNWQGFVDVETSIATNSFAVPYFQKAAEDPLQYIQLPTRPPMKCVQGQWVTMNVDDPVETTKPNFMLDRTWQFRTKYIYTDGRESEWGPISTAYYVERTEAQKNAKGLPRSIRLRFSAGHPQVEKIVLAYRNCNGNAYAETNPSDFSQYDVIEKYEECLPGTKFWQRSVRANTAELSYDAATNEFVYLFDGNKECTPVPVSETLRTQNPCPIISQALAVMENRLVLFNNKVSYAPIDCKQVRQFQFTATEPPPLVVCTPQFVTVRFRVLIHNIFRQTNGFIYIMGNDATTEQKHFGGITFKKGPFDTPVPYKQSFYGTQAGFIGYVEGTGYYGITEQWKDNKRERIKWPVEYGMGSRGRRNDVAENLADKEHWFQEGEIRVPKGTKGFLRLAGHGASPASKYADTSTTVFGVFKSYSGNYNGQTNISSGNTTFRQYEIFFDASGGDVDLRNTPFIVADLTAPFSDLANPYAATAMFGYLRDSQGNPVERAEVEYYGRSAVGTFSSPTTDHNGFYFISWTKYNNSFLSTPIGARFYVEGPGCAKQLGADQSFRSGTMPNVAEQRDVTVDRVEQYAEKYYTTVKMKVLDSRGVALPGVMVVIGGGKAKPTENSGEVSLQVRNRMIYYGTPFSEQMVVMQGATPYTIAGSACDYTMPHWTVAFEACFSGSDGRPRLIETGYEVRLSTNFNVERGLKTGGRYGFAPVFHDATGRHSFVPQDVTYLTLPTVQEKQSFAFPLINWQLNGDLVLPPWVRYISFYRTGNIAFNFYQQWVIDKVRYVDSNGKETEADAASRVHLTIQSLINFNTKYAGTTNSAYQFVRGDRVQILADEKGTLIPRSEGIMDFLILADHTEKYEQQGRDPVTVYEIVLDFDGRLATLKEGSLIQITRSADCVTEQMFFELCDRIDVKDGKPVVTSGRLNTFDTYHVAGDVVFDGNVRTVPFTFEHHSPSYHWGDHCDDRGRVNVKNEWEKEMTYGRSAYVSDVFLENGNRTGISTFREEAVKYFNGADRGDITFAYGIHRAIKILCQHGSFMVGTADDYVRLGRDGVARAAMADQFMQEMNGGASNFGLHYSDISAVYADPAFLCWLDRDNGSIVLDNFNEARDVAAHKISGYLSGKIAWANAATKPVRTLMGYDPVAKKALLTFFDGRYVSNRQDYDVMGNETFGIYVEKGTIFMQSFTPESFATFNNSLKGPVFFSFKGGEPWVHGEKELGSFNTFFGVAVDQVLKLVISGNQKVLNLLSLQQHSTMKYYSPRITTTGWDSNTNSAFQMQSELPPIVVRGSLGRFNASFLFNKLTPHVDIPLYNGEALRGEVAFITFVRDNTTNDNLTPPNDQKRAAYSELNGFYFLFSLAEQSAYNQT